MQRQLSIRSSSLLELGRFARSLKDALFPAKCLGCGQLFLHTGSLSGRYAPAGMSFPATGLSSVLAHCLCPDCRNQWTPVTSPLCSRCGVVFSGREGEDHLCGRCLRHPTDFYRARAVGIHDQALRVAIGELKFNGRVNLAGPLGELMFAEFTRHWSRHEIDMVAPVPLHRRRFRRRGFNQAFLLVCGWPTEIAPPIVRDLLVRARNTASQTGLDRHQRKKNIRNAFFMNHPGKSTGKRILLVDDVLTTGATANACARTLLADGARRVDVLTLARAL